jgi:hypothetical protein
MPSKRILSALFVVALAGGATVVACSSSSSSSDNAQCNSNPWSCPAGQTCWLKDASGNFACLNSAAGKNKGDPCTNTVGLPSCGDAMACYQQLGASGGTCVAYCDNANAAHGCAAGETCQEVAVVLPSGASGPFFVCIGGAPPVDSGTDTNFVPPDTGSGDGEIGIPPGDSFSPD